MKWLVGAVALLALAGCVAMGVQVTESQLKSFERGKSTVGQVVSSLGQPTSSTLSADGTRMLMYMYTEAQARPESFIPYVGAFIGGSDSRSNMVMMRFDASGVLIDYTASTSQIGTGTGFSSGTEFNRVPVRQAPKETLDK